MKGGLSLLLLIIVILFCGVNSQGECGPGRSCAAGFCCSQWGYCGQGSAFCSTTAAATTTTATTATATTGSVRQCNPRCAANECCSKWGYCGTTAEHCEGTGAASTVSSTASSSSSNTGATTGSGSCKLSQIFSQNDFNALFPNANAGSRNTALKNQKAIFTYSNLIAAADYYPLFACDGDVNTRKKELAAFLAQTSQETSGWWAGQQYVWGYVYSTELGPSGTGCDASACPYCQNSGTNPCTSGQGYYGRGPLQLSWNYNYGPVSRAVFNDNRLLTNPDALLDSGVTAFRTSLWFWMTAQSPKPSCHDVIVGKWSPSSSDVSAGRLSGFGMTTNVINGGLECSVPTPQKVENRVRYFDRYTQYFGISMGSNTYCNNMQHY